MSVEEAVGCLKIHDKRLCGYDDREVEQHRLLTHEKWLARTKKKDVVDSSFSGMKVHGGHNKKSRGCGRGRGHDNGRSGKEGRDNTSQIHNIVNSWKDKSMIKCYACEKY